MAPAATETSLPSQSRSFAEEKKTSFHFVSRWMFSFSRSRAPQAKTNPSEQKDLAAGTSRDFITRRALLCRTRQSWVYLQYVFPLPLHQLHAS